MTKKQEPQGVIKASVELEFPSNQSLAWVLGASRASFPVPNSDAKRAMDYTKALVRSARELGLPSLPKTPEGLPDWLEAVTSKARKGVR